MTRYLQDILRQPDELRKTLEHICGAGQHELEDAAVLLRRSQHIYLTGIGSSWHAAMAAAALFNAGGCPVHLHDAAELLHFATFPPDSSIVAISRTGRSVEIVQLLQKARKSGAAVIGVTNVAEGPLAREAQIPLIIPVILDHGISVNTYSTLACAAGALASITVSSFDDALASTLSRAVLECKPAIPIWQEQIAQSDWLVPRGNYHFLARGSSLASCHEARLLWEEGAKTAATAMGTSGFRHGPQEIVEPGLRFGIWIDGERMRSQDCAVARDLKRLGSSVMLIGQRLSEDPADLMLELPAIPEAWQFLIDIIPAQLASEHLAELSGVDCDSFRYSSYIVEDEYGLTNDKVAVPKETILRETILKEPILKEAFLREEDR
jgi:glutamine---fructose-6-phosphate transaminase (isomerizing)